MLNFSNHSFFKHSTWDRNGLKFSNDGIKNINQLINKTGYTTKTTKIFIYLTKDTLPKTQILCFMSIFLFFIIILKLRTRKKSKVVILSEVEELYNFLFDKISPFQSKWQIQLWKGFFHKFFLISTFRVRDEFQPWKCQLLSYSRKRHFQGKASFINSISLALSE